MLSIDLKIGQSLKIGPDITVTLEDKSGRTAKLSIDAPRSVKVERVPQVTPAALAAAGGITGQP